jgi:hypothetical protein
MTWRQAVEKIVFDLLKELKEDGQTIDEFLVLKGKEGQAISDILCMIAADNHRSLNFIPSIFWNGHKVVCELDFWKPTPTLTKWRMQG